MVDTPPIDAASRKDARDALRKHVHTLRCGLSDTAQQHAAHCVQQRVLPELEGVHRLSGYLAMRGELSITTLMQHAREQGIETLVPVIRGKRLRFAPLHAQTRFTRHAFGIDEPDVPDEELLHVADLDLMLVPLVGFDRHCNRLGMGGGFYDRSLAEAGAERPRLIGVAHGLQLLDSTLPEHWDVGLDAVVTDNGAWGSLSR